MNPSYRQEISATFDRLRTCLKRFEKLEIQDDATFALKALYDAADEASDVHTLVNEHIQRYEGDRTAG